MKTRVFVQRGRHTYELVTSGEVSGECWKKCSLKFGCGCDVHPCDDIWWAAKEVMDHFTGIKEVTHEGANHIPKRRCSERDGARCE